MGRQQEDPPSLTSQQTLQNLLQQKGHTDASPEETDKRPRAKIESSPVINHNMKAFAAAQHTHTHTYLACAGTPQVDTRAKSHAEDVQRRPVHEVEVEVVLKLWSVQHFEGNLRYFACGFPWWPQQFLAAVTKKLLRHRAEKTQKQNKLKRLKRKRHNLLLLTGDRE